MGPHRSWERKRNNITVVYPLVSLLDSTGCFQINDHTDGFSKICGASNKCYECGRDIYKEEKGSHGWEKYKWW